MTYTRGDTVTVHRDPLAYISHPSITVLANGEWLAAFNHGRRRKPNLHPPGDPLFFTLTTRSADGGRTWSEPQAAPNYDWYGTECPGVTALRSGRTLLCQYRFRWYPLDLARKRRNEGEQVAIRLDKRWTEEFSDHDWERSDHPWARANHGVYVHLSDDNGRTFDRTVPIDTAPYRDGYSRTGPTEQSDGRLAYALTEHVHPNNRYTYIVFSSDGGESWGPPSLIHDASADVSNRIFNEPDIIEVAPGELYCVLRVRDHRRSGYLHASRSLDGGKTWSPVEKTALFGYPGHLVRLADGRLLCTYGRRNDAPIGIRACLSDDGGRTWNTEEEIVIRDDFPNSDCGYPTTIEYAPGRLFCCYYRQDAEGVTYVEGTYVDLA